jgi:hypothetical protein
MGVERHPFGVTFHPEPGTELAQGVGEVRQVGLVG